MGQKITSMGQKTTLGYQTSMSQQTSMGKHTILGRQTFMSQKTSWIVLKQERLPRLRYEPLGMERHRRHLQ
jgi:hypothetical protein